MHFFHNYTERSGYGKNVDKGILDRKEYTEVTYNVTLDFLLKVRLG